jgi:hypothetical protein
MRGSEMIAQIWRGGTRAEDSQVVRASRDQTPDQPLLCEQEAPRLLGSDPTRARNEVVVDPRRARLYTDLRRRFPLRIAAPR